MKSFVKVCLVAALCCMIAGICILAAVQPFQEKGTFGTGEEQQFSWNADEEVKQIVLQIKAGEVMIEEGECFQVNLTNIKEEDITCRLEKQVWTILDNRSVSGVTTVFPISINGFEEEENTKVKVTVPKGFQAEKLELELGAGEMRVEKLVAEKLLVTAGAGSINLHEMRAEESVYFRIGAGEIRAYDFTGCNMTAECGVGELYVDGTITGDSEIECGIGEVVCELSGKEEDYSYSVECGIGDVIIGKQEYHGISKNSKIGTGEDSFHVQCGIGSVKISFEND